MSKTHSYADAQAKACARGNNLFTGELKNTEGFNSDRSSLKIGDTISPAADEPIISVASRRGNDYPAVVMLKGEEELRISWNGFLFSSFFTTDPDFNLAAHAETDLLELAKTGKIFTAYRYGVANSKAVAKPVKEYDTDSDTLKTCYYPEGLVEVTFDAEAYLIPTKWDNVNRVFNADPDGKLRLTAFVEDGIDLGAEAYQKPAADAE